MATDKKPIWERTRPGIHAETKLRDRDFVMAGHHCHTCFELFYVQSGACRFLVDESLFDLVEGDFILIPPLALHYTRYLFGPCKRTVVLFQKDDIGEASRRFMPREEGFFTGSAVFSVPREYRERVAGCLGHMSDEEALGDDQSLLMRQLSLQWLFLLCHQQLRLEVAQQKGTCQFQLLQYFPDWHCPVLVQQVLNDCAERIRRAILQWHRCIQQWQSRISGDKG